LIGAGYESFWLGERLKKIWSLSWEERPNQAHNGYLEVFLDLGWVGAILLALVMAAGYWNITQTLQQNSRIGGLRLSFFVVAAAYNLTEHAFRELHPVWICFLLAVVVVPVESSQEGAWQRSATALTNRDANRKRAPVGPPRDTSRRRGSVARPSVEAAGKARGPSMAPARFERKPARSSPGQVAGQEQPRRWPPRRGEEQRRG
jgi:hypothetical protein